MNALRPFVLVSAVSLALAGDALIGSVQQARPGGAPGHPLDSLHFRPIGPASMSGRVADLAVYEANPAVYYVGTAHGGVWKTTNHGTTFESGFVFAARVPVTSMPRHVKIVVYDHAADSIGTASATFARR